MQVSRRAFMASAAALAATPFLPATVSASTAVSVAPETTIWIAGHAGEFDWHPFHAKTRVDALRQALYHHGFGTGDEVEELLALSEQDLAKRLDSASFGLDRVPSMDGLQPEDIKPYHWIDAGMGAFCQRCDSECYSGDGGRVFGAEVVCEDCTTIPDLLGSEDDDDIERAEERLVEWFLGHDCDETSVRKQMSKDFDPDFIPPHIWQKRLQEAREEG